MVFIFGIMLANEFCSHWKSCAYLTES